MSSPLHRYRMFESVVPVRSWGLHPAVSSTRDRYIELFGESPDDRGGWYSRDDWHRISFALSCLGQGERFLDVGLGAGQFINSVASLDHYQEVFGSDIFRFNKYTELHDVIERRDASVAELPYDDNYFDVVTCMEVVEHVPDEIFDAALSELRRVCRGQLIMSVPFEEVPPLSAGHKRRFEFADLHRCFPDASFTLLYRPSTPWAIAEEWHGPEPTPAPRTAAGVSTAGWRGTASRAAMTIPPTTRSRLERLARRVRRIGPSRSTN